jgi:enoyl-CoA hydratase/carnithine racemase
MPAEEGLAWGFFNRLVAPEQLLPESLALAKSLAEGPTFAHAMTKNQLNVEWDLSLDAALESEAQAQAICMQTADFRRAYEAFVRKEKPRFEGD